MMECDCTDYSYAVRDGAQHIVQFQYKQRAACMQAARCRQWNRVGPQMASDGVASRRICGRARGHSNMACGSLKSKTHTLQQNT